MNNLECDRVKLKSNNLLHNDPHVPEAHESSKSFQSKEFFYLMNFSNQKPIWQLIIDSLIMLIDLIIHSSPVVIFFFSSARFEQSGILCIIN